MESGQYGEGGNIASVEFESSNYAAVLSKDVGKMDTSEANTSQNNSTLSSIVENTPVVNSISQPEINSVEKELLIVNNFEFKFSHLYNGPFYAYIQHTSKNIGRLHEMAVGRLLHEELGIKAAIKEICKAGYNRIKVEMKSMKDVVNLVNNASLKSKNLHAYVPKHLTEIRGVIKFVDTSISEEKLLHSIECDGMVKGVKRTYKKIIKDDKSTQLVPRQTVIVSFYGNKLPPFVYINSCRRAVEVFIGNVVQCFKCLRFGHVAKICKSKEQRCKNCGDAHEGLCNAGTMCIHCRSTSHNGLSKICEKYLTEKKIKRFMAENRVTYNEAKNSINNPNSFVNKLSSNRFTPLLYLQNHAEFPSLTENNYSQSIIRPKPQATSNSVKKRKVISPTSNISQPHLPINKERTVNIFNKEVERESPFVQNVNLVESITEFIESIFSNSNYIFDKQTVKENLKNIVNVNSTINASKNSQTR